MYFGKHTQQEVVTDMYTTVEGVTDMAERMEWEDCEWVLMETSRLGGFDLVYEAEFPCTYSFHYGDMRYTCELTSNRPDSLCPFHAGEED